MSNLKSGCWFESATPARAAEIQSWYPENPFYLAAYGAALQGAGSTIGYIIQTGQQSEVAACLVVFHRVHRGAQVMELPSLTRMPDPSAFWSKLQSIAKARGLSRVDLNTFCSPEINIPYEHFESFRKKRTEWIVSLTEDNFSQRFSKHHQRQIRRAERMDLQLVVGQSRTHVETHERLVIEGIKRRDSPGSFTPSRPIADPLIQQLVSHGAGVLYQAELNGDAVGSILVLESCLTAYYHSAGASPQGYKVGASPWLIAQAANILVNSGKRSFNLGGTRQGQEGLIRFKSGFGGTHRNLESVSWNIRQPFGKVFLRMLKNISVSRSR